MDQTGTTRPLDGEASTAPRPAPAAPPSQGPRPGDEAFFAAGRFTEPRLLGEGAMGTVYRAFDPTLHRTVAIKLIRVRDRELAARFLQEARAQARIRHPHVCQVFEAGEAGGRPYLSMQYIEGRTLREVAPELGLRARVQLFAQVCEGVHAAHLQRILHRDLKPANVMVETHGEGQSAYVCDFGLARIEGLEKLTDTGETVGTPAYMSPEQIERGAVPLGPRSDVFSLGASLYEVLCGRLPFQGQPFEVLRRIAHEEPPSPRSLAPGLPADLEAVVLKALEKDPERRYGSAKALAEDLQRWLAGRPVLARLPGPLGRALRWVGRHRGRTLAAALLLALATTTAGWAVRASYRARVQARLAQRFGGRAEAIGASLSKAFMLPRHDVGPDLERANAELAALEGEVRREGAWAVGPGRSALGEAHLALGQLKEAQREFSAAWDAGYRGPEVSLGLGLAQGRRYLAELKDLGGPAAEDARRRWAPLLRDPALEHLRRARGLGESSPTLEATLALLEERWDDAVRWARLARAAQPWLLDAWETEAGAHALEGGARDRRDGAGKGDAARVQALAVLEEALQVGRSCPALYEARAQAAAAACLQEGMRGRPADPARAEACVEEALRCAPASGSALLSRAQARLGAVLGGAGPSAWDPALDAARAALARNPRSPRALWCFLEAHRAVGARRAAAGRDPRPLLREALTAASAHTEARRDPAVREALERVEAMLPR